MSLTQEELQTRFDQSQTTGDFSLVIAGLKELFDIEQVHESVIRYLEQLRLNAIPNKPFYLMQWGELAKHCLTYEAVFGIDEAGYFPAILIAGSFMSIEFYLMVESGAIVVMHSDSTTEIGDDLYEDELSEFHDALLADYSIFNIDQFLAIKQAFAGTPDEDFSDIDPEEFFTKLAGALGWNLAKLHENRYHSAFDWMLDITEEYGDLLKELSES